MGSVDESVDVDETQGLVSGGYHKGYTGHLDKINYINEDDLPDPPCFPIMPKALGKPYKPMDPAVSREAPAIFKPKNFGLDDDGKPKFTWKDDKIFDYAYCSLNGFGGHQVCYCNPKGCLGHNQVMKCCGQMQATSCMRTDQRVCPPALRPASSAPWCCPGEGPDRRMLCAVQACLQIQSEEDQCPFLCDGQKDTCLLAYGSSSMTSYACCCFTKMVQMGNCDFKRCGCTPASLHESPSPQAPTSLSLLFVVAPEWQQRLIRGHDWRWVVVHCV
eukprot:COSAG01_NODE_2572_length_7436_cov_3.363500_2_plen_274_part_00